VLAEQPRIPAHSLLRFPKVVLRTAAVVSLRDGLMCADYCIYATLNMQFLIAVYRTSNYTTTMSKLMDVKNLSAESGLPVRKIRTLMQRRVIPFIKIGHRSCLFDLEKVRKALDKFEVKTASR